MAKKLQTTKKTPTPAKAMAGTAKETKPLITPSVIKKERVTEKAARAAQINTYIFDVSVTATKSEVAKAFTAKYKHKPLRVNLVTERAKSYFRKGVLGFGKRGKKAYVTVPKGTKIEII